ncbi:hypothetical protein CTX76_004415 [Salmonella enterica subsp. houtenae]|uniref:Transposase n=4 Tax=Salmonella enterica TaxID=28901 RepID=A0A5V1IT61_SALER|nr:hypothetical protein [Salmonella enterica]EAA3682416.1 hypothetical protein [Salmonella enterica subsp. houtenae]EBP3985385.1 hypothetical protein [Salmonella enterica subsp. enterica]EBR0110849.1 hypothetical protein [Salmonella enterica subsp. houtenae serovar Houten]EDG3662130.1 hypothetical protein [Salmonella enterica subsp. enterica serovar Give]EDP9792819.1 hypothetical protein [Salmonella enterica subsp. salamae]EDX4413197.1 hypothetical protein [Salmonella enterica subsp. houtenae
MKKTRYTEEQIAFALKQAETGTRIGDVLGCCLHLSGIRKTCAQMGNPHTIASTTGRPLRPV